MVSRRAFTAGLRDIVPVLLSLFPIGVIVGLTAVDIGLTDGQAIWMALGIYTGLAQAAMLELMAQDANLAVIVLAGVLVNLRLMMYSASIAPYLDRLSLPQRLPVAYFLIDVVYALSFGKFEGDASIDRPAYFLGAGVGAWSAWQVGTLVGVFFGGVVPEGLDLQFAIPLVFVALLVPLLEERPALVAGVLAGGVAVLAVGLPFDLGLLTGTAVGIATGVFAERRWSP